MENKIYNNSIERMNKRDRKANKLKSEYKASENKTLAFDLIDAYKNNEILNIRTVENLLSKLSSHKKVVKESGVKRSMEIMTDLRLTKGIEWETQALRPNMKFKRFFIQNKVIGINEKLNPYFGLKVNGKRSFGDVDILDRILIPAFNRSLKLIDKSTNYKIHASVERLNLHKEEIFNATNGNITGSFEEVKELLDHPKSKSFAKGTTYKDFKDKDKLFNEMKVIMDPQSDQVILLPSLTITFIFQKISAGGCCKREDIPDGIIKNRNIITVINGSPTNNQACFWLALTNTIYKNHKDIRHIKENKDTYRNPLARDLCNRCNMEWNKKVSLEDLRHIEQSLNISIVVFDRLPEDDVKAIAHIVIEKACYFNTKQRPEKVYLFYDDKNQHYHTITNIQGFFGCKRFCDKCMKTFNNVSTFDVHKCEDSGKNNGKKARIDRSPNEISRYLESFEVKGGEAEIQFRKERRFKDKCKEFMKEIENGNIPNDEYKRIKEEAEEWGDTMGRKAVEEQKYIIYDLEADQTKEEITNLNKHNIIHCEVEKLLVNKENDTYDKCLVEEKSFNGDDVMGQFCKWLFGEGNNNHTVIAHNQSGYDGKFILEWGIMNGMYPSDYLRAGNKILYMRFKKNNLRFIDSILFLQQPLAKLSEIYNIETLKGYFPFYVEDQNYKGKTPDPTYFGIKNMMPEKHKEFLKWYSKVKKDDWDFKVEIKKYCKDDVKLLSQAVLIFRKSFKDKLDIDPWRYTTLPSLCMAIYRGIFMPKNKIVANENNRESTLACKTWLSYLGILNKVYLEHRITCDVKGNFKEGKIGKKNKIFNNKTVNFCLDAYDPETNTAYEFNGCAFHGCQDCNACFRKEDKEYQYNRTVEKATILKANGYKLIEIRECDFNRILRDHPNKDLFTRQAINMNIKTRDALFGGRTEAFKSYHKCTKNQRIHYLDFVSLYPTVNALDEYATGFRRYRPETTEDDILNDTFIGLVKCKYYPPKDLYLPPLPNRTDKGLLFSLEPGQGTFTTIELRKALQKGYKIEILSAVEYDRTKHLMRDYVSYFLKLKTQYSGNKTQEEVDELNKFHESIGLNMDYLTLKSEECCNNPGLKQIAKLCLNSLWGKFGQSIEKEQSIFIKDNTELMRYLTDDKNVIKNIIDIYNHRNTDYDAVELRYTEDRDKFIEADYISEITAVFTTSNARVRLYEFMDKLHNSQIFYCDTDSCIFLVDDDNKNHVDPFKRDDISIGKGLGQLEDELKGDYIEELVIGGAKSYAYKTKKGKIENKQKGIVMDISNQKLVSFERYKTLVLNDDIENNKIETALRPTFVFDSKKYQLVTKYIPKNLQTTITNKRQKVKDSYDTLPVGYT